MKKSIVLIAGLFFLSPLLLHAQFIKKGTIVGSGSFEFKSHKDDANNKQSNFGLMPWAGYMVIDNLTAGAGLLVSTSKSESEFSPGTTYTNTGTDILFGPVVRYYLDNGLFVHGQYFFGSSKNVTKTTGLPDSESKFGKTELRLGAGYAVRITDTVLFEPFLGYLNQGSKDKTSGSTSSKVSENGFFFMGGFTIFLHSVE